MNRRSPAKQTSHNRSTLRVGRSPLAAPAQILVMVALVYLVLRLSAHFFGDGLSTIQVVGVTLIDDAQWLLPALLAVTLAFYAAMIAQQVTGSDAGSIRRTRNLLGYYAEGVSAVSLLIVILCMHGSQASSELPPRLIAIAILALIVTILAAHTGAFVIGSEEKRLRIAEDALSNAQRSLSAIVPSATLGRALLVLILTPLWSFGVVLGSFAFGVVSYSLVNIPIPLSTVLINSAWGVIPVCVALAILIPAKLLFVVNRSDPGIWVLTVGGSLAWSGLILSLIVGDGSPTNIAWSFGVGVAIAAVWIQGPYARAIDGLAAPILNRKMRLLQAQLEALRKSIRAVS